MDPIPEFDLWMAFLLGARVVAEQDGRRITGAEFDALSEIVRQLAEGDTTLEDPTATASMSPEIGELLIQLESMNIKSNRELAKRIYQGYIEKHTG